MATCETGQDRPGPLHVHNSSSGKSNGFLLKTGKRKRCASAPRLLFSKEIKGKVLCVSALGPRSICQSAWTDTCCGKIICWIFLRGVTQVWTSQEGQWWYHMHISVCCRCFLRQREWGPDGIAMETKLIVLIHLYFNNLMSFDGKSWESPRLRSVLPLKIRECEISAAHQQLQGPLVR